MLQLPPSSCRERKETRDSGWGGTNNHICVKRQALWIQGQMVKDRLEAKFGKKVLYTKNPNEGKVKILQHVIVK